jgi:uncharacterized membrane protein YuzA (DUF378 family)
MVQWASGWTLTYVKAKVFYLAMALLLLNGLNALLVALTDRDVLQWVMGKGVLGTLLYGLIGLSALLIMFDRDTYLPFLGPTVMPCGALQDREPPGATKEIRVSVVPHRKIIYWAAEPANENLKTISSWQEAYQKYENAGVTTSDGTGQATLRIRAPRSYQVPTGGVLDPHIHYRVCEEAGWMGRIYTVPVNENEKKAVEGFSEEESFAAVM